MKTSQPEVELGEKLVRQLWADIKDRNTEGAGKMIAQGFQSVHQDGARNREQEIGLIKELDLGKYNLSDFTVTQNGPVIVATNSVSAEETIDGKRLSTEAAPRLDVFLKTDSGWQLIAHANLKPLT
ncbi:MAG: nuclear transport factor 2 family protein [Deltaproteobacteria bacterium]|nr:nuclear transport factor 2 family protein [Deltaproteobacteria bacterium]